MRSVLIFLILGLLTTFCSNNNNQWPRGSEPLMDIGEVYDSLGYPTSYIETFDTFMSESFEFTIDTSNFSIRVDSLIRKEYAIYSEGNSIKPYLFERDTIKKYIFPSGVGYNSIETPRKDGYGLDTLWDPEDFSRYLALDTSYIVLYHSLFYIETTVDELPSRLNFLSRFKKKHPSYYYNLKYLYDYDEKIMGKNLTPNFIMSIISKNLEEGDRTWFLLELKGEKEHPLAPDLDILLSVD